MHCLFSPGALFVMRLLAGLVFAACAIPAPSQAATYYVADPKGPDGVAGTADDADASDSYAGTQAKPFATLGKSCSVAVAGDTVLIRAGIYKQTLRPLNSGVAGSPVTFKAYPGEQPLITQTPGLTNLTPDEVAVDQTGRQYGIYIYGRSYVTLQGLSVTNVSGWARIVNSNHIVIRDGNFTNATAAGTTGSIKFYGSHYNAVTGNILDAGNDNVLLIHSDRNLVARNRITSGRHALWCIRASNFNVIRDNYFYNAIQKIGEVYDAETDPPIIYDATKHNLIERNEFAWTASSGNASPYAGIQYAGQEGIIRLNIFHSTIGPALDLTLYSNEARYNTHNRIYNNVFQESSFAGINISGSTSYTFLDNIMRNNILANSIFVANDTRWTWYTQVLAGKPVQLMTGRLNNFVFENNNLFNSASGELYLITYGLRDSSSNPPPQTLSWWQSNYPGLFKANIKTDPMYVDKANNDFHLRPGSPMIDAGMFLTKAVGSGTGTVLPVEDARYFFDGFGIADENGQPVPGDLIQLGGQAGTARVLQIDYAANTLRLDRPVTWTAGQGVGLWYYGTRPDIGAYEYASPTNHPPVAVNDAFGVLANSSGNVLNVLVNDSDPDPGDVLTITDVTNPLHGTVEIQVGSTALRYTPASGYGGPDSFTYTISDGNGGAATAIVRITVTTDPPKVTAVMFNGRQGRSVSTIEPSGIGVRTVTVRFSKPVTFDDTAVVAEAVTFDGGVETITETLVPQTLTGSDTDTMTLEFDNASVVDTWVKITILGDGSLHDAGGQALDGEAPAGGSGRGYLYSAVVDLPSGDGVPGGDVVFYVGSLRGDFNGDGFVTVSDKAGFLAAWNAKSLDADFRGVGFGVQLPDGKITLGDIDGFTSVYLGAVAASHHLDPLPP